MSKLKELTSLLTELKTFQESASPVWKPVNKNQLIKEIEDNYKESNVKFDKVKTALQRLNFTQVNDPEDNGADIDATDFRLLADDSNPDYGYDSKLFFSPSKRVYKINYVDNGGTVNLYVK